MKKGQSRITNNISDTRRREAKQKTHHNMCWTPLCTNKRKSHGTQKVKTHNRTTAKKMSNTDHTKQQGVNSGAREG
jgi:hypothetical protein